MNRLFQTALLWLALALAGVTHAADFPGTKVLFETGKAEIPTTSAGDLKAWPTTWQPTRRLRSSFRALSIRPALPM